MSRKITLKYESVCLTLFPGKNNFYFFPSPHRFSFQRGEKSLNILISFAKIFTNGAVFSLAQG